MKERASARLRLLDRYLGIPLVFFLSLFKRKRSLQKQEKIAVLVTAGIGDTVLLTAILQDLEGKEITLFTGQANAEMGRMIPGVQVVALPITSPLKALRLIRKERFDVWIDANPWPRINALFSFFSKSSFTIGFKTSNQYRHPVYDYAISHLANRHELENLRALLIPLAIEPKHQPFLRTKKQKREEKLIMLHPYAGGSRAELKEWPEPQWIALIEALMSKGYRIILSGGPGDTSRLNALRRRCPFSEKIALTAGKLSLLQTAELLGRISRLVSVDTGVMHMAAALGCPVIALHGPTSPHRWGGIGKNVIALQQDFPYTPCIHLGFEAVCNSNTCMKNITLEAVLSALLLST